MTKTRVFDEKKPVIWFIRRIGHKVISDSGNEIKIHNEYHARLLCEYQTTSAKKYSAVKIQMVDRNFKDFG